MHNPLLELFLDSSCPDYALFLKLHWADFKRRTKLPSSESWKLVYMEFSGVLSLFPAENLQVAEIYPAPPC